MNINTNTLLNTLLTKVDPMLKAKIEKLSSDGKIDISNVSKDKGIQTLLIQLFKDISMGTKNKAEVVNLLNNSQNSLKFKTISTDLKQIINSIKTEMKNIPELEKFVSVLKNSIVDIKNVDEKMIKSNFKNSGVFLESKLSQSTQSVSQNIKNLVGQLNNKLVLLETMPKTISNQNSTTTQLNKNLNVEKTLLNEIKNTIKSEISLLDNKQMKKNINTDRLLNNKEIKNTIKSENLLLSNKEMKNDVKLEKPLTTNTTGIKNELTTEKGSLNNNVVKNELKTDIQNVLKKIEIASQPDGKFESKGVLLKNALDEIKIIDEKIVKSDIKTNITTNLKEAVQQVKNNILNNLFIDTKKAIIIIKEQLENIKSDNTLEFKKEILKIDPKLDLLNNEKNIEKKAVILKELIQQTVKMDSKIDSSNLKELLKNNIGINKNITGDLKTVMLQVKELIELPNNSETTSKELKNNVDKVLSQIDYYQLSSYSSNSNHSYLSFLQDDLEDVDIKFNNDNDDDISCLIQLSLKEQGDLKILLQLDKKNGLNINIGVQQEEFKKSIQNAIQLLRVKINSLGLSILSLNIFDLSSELQKSDELKAYGANINLDFGLDIKV